jgi:hypothetical protein
VLPDRPGRRRYVPFRHSVDRTTEQMIRSVLAYAENRLRLDPVPLDTRARTPEQLATVFGGLLLEEGAASQRRCWSEPALDDVDLVASRSDGEPLRGQWRHVHERLDSEVEVA